MKLILIFDHRFFRTRDGILFAENVYNYQFFAERYLRVFDEVSIVSRVADRSDLETPTVPGTEGPGVKLVPLPNWKGAAGFLRNRSNIIATALSAIDRESAVLMIAPGGLASILFDSVRSRGYPIALEVVSDPWNTFQPGAYDHVLRSLVRSWTARTLRKQCRGACAVSYVTSDFLQQRYPCPSFSSGISDVVLPEAAFLRQPRSYGPSTTTKIVCVGVMNRCKGHEVLLQAVALTKGAPSKFSLVMVGDGPLREHLEQRAAQLEIASRVHFVGRLSAGESVRAELDRADVFVLPSLTEGMPRALLEAMARGLPCVASNVGGIPEVLPPDALISAGDAKGLAHQLVSLSSNPEWLSAMSRLNLQKAAEYKDTVLMKKRIEFYQYIRRVNENRHPSYTPSCAKLAIQ